MNNEPVKAWLGADTLLMRDNQVLLQLRTETDQWHVPGGRLDGNERFIHAAVREIEEELGVTIEPEDLKLSHIMHGLVSHGEGVICFFMCKQWKWEPTNLEPEKHSDIRWFDLDDLPDNIAPWYREFLETGAREEGLTFSESGL